MFRVTIEIDSDHNHVNIIYEYSSANEKYQSRKDVYDTKSIILSKFLNNMYQKKLSLLNIPNIELWIDNNPSILLTHYLELYDEKNTGENDIYNDK